jgi:hypothetical protein
MNLDPTDWGAPHIRRPCFRNLHRGRHQRRGRAGRRKNVGPEPRAALKNQHRQFVIDGEAVVLGVHGLADFNALHSRKHDEEVQLHVFDIMPAGQTNLAGLLALPP